MIEKPRNLTLPRPQTPASITRLRARLAPYVERLEAIVGPPWSRARAWYEKREPREKVLLRILGVVVGLLFLYNAIYVPMISLRQDLADRAITRQQQLIDVRGMMRTYERLRTELAATEKHTVPGGNDFSLFSVLEQTLTKSVGREKIGSITPGDHPVPGGFTQYTVDVKLNGISLAQVVDTLYGVQVLTVPVTVSNLQVREHAQDAHSYDVDMTCMALGKRG
jgi:hypothetical protein